MLGISEGLPDQTMPPLGQPSLIRRRSEERERELSRPGSGLKRTIPGLENIQELSEALEMSSVAKFTKSRRTGPVFCPSSPSGAMVELLARSFEDPNPCPKIEISVRTRAEDVASNRTSPKGSSSPQGAAGEPMDPYMMRSSVADGDFDFTASDYYGVVTSSSPATAAREEEKERTAGDGVGGMAQPSLVQESHYHRPSHAQQGVRIHANKTLYAGTIYRRVREGSPAEYTFNFRKFWGILIGAELYFFESAGSTTQLDKLLLTGCRIDALSGLNDLQWKLSFPKRGQTEDFTEFFRADSSQEMRDWVAAIGTAASAKIISSPSASRPWRLSRDQPATRVILVRHGHYINAGSKATDAEKVLSEMGRKQAQLTADFLQRHGYNKRNRSVAIEYSTLTRARETAEIIASLFGGNDLLESSDLLIEGWPGQPFPIPGLPSPNEAKQSNSAPHSPALERMQVKQMVENLRLMKSFHTYFVREADEPDDMLKIIVCHANIIRYFICKVLGVPYLGVWGQMEIDHCSLTRVDVYNDGTMKLISMNEVGHLPENLQTSSKDHI